MAILVPDIGLDPLIKYMLGYVEPSEDIVYHWYTNDYEPEASSELSDFTEASGSAISPLTVASEDWSFDVSDGIVTATQDEVEVLVSDAVVIYGYYVTTPDDVLLWAEKFEYSPFTWGNAGGKMLFTPKIEMASPII